MKKSYFFYVVGIAILMVYSFCTASAEGLIYDFDEVNVKYATEFTLNPSGNVDDNNWISWLAGGSKEPINVLYGIVDLMKDGQVEWSEEFIKVSGKNGSERFLANSGWPGYSQWTNNIKHTRLFFWSAKKLIGNSVVKDKTLPVKSLLLDIKISETSNDVISASLSLSDDGIRAGEDFWYPERQTNYVNLYEMTTAQGLSTDTMINPIGSGTTSTMTGVVN